MNYTLQCYSIWFFSYMSYQALSNTMKIDTCNNGMLILKFKSLGILPGTMQFSLCHATYYTISFKTIIKWTLNPLLQKDSVAVTWMTSAKITLIVREITSCSPKFCKFQNWKHLIREKLLNYSRGFHQVVQIGNCYSLCSTFTTHVTIWAHVM